MLDLRRIETGKLPLKMELFSLNNLIDEIKSDILVSNPAYIINVKHDVYANIFADRDRIGQVPINFINTAIKYSLKSTYLS
jgi:signal transduction histidine kinase